MNALCLPLLFFLHGFHPHIPPFELLALSFFRRSDYDEWLIDLQKEYDPPNGEILVLETAEPGHDLSFLPHSIRQKKSMLAVVHGRQSWESVPYPGDLWNRFGLVIMEKPKEVMSSYHLEYCYMALVEGGKLLIVEGHKVRIAITKTHHGNDDPLPPLLILPLNDDDMKVLQWLMHSVPHLANRILLAGNATHWIDRLRRAGWIAYGVDTNRDNLTPKDVYYSMVSDYQVMPFQSNFFKLICLFVEADTETLMEVHRLLMEGGYVGLMAQRDRYYEDVLRFLGYKRTGIVFHGMPLWQKKIEQESA